MAAKFVMVHGDDGIEIFVNINNIEYVQKNGSRGFGIRTNSSDYITGDEGYNEIIATIRKLTEIAS